MLIFIYFFLQFEIIFAGMWKKVPNLEELDCRELIKLIIPTNFNLDLGIHDRIKEEKNRQ